jgi:3-hydroxyisobutyrate dehydrogenase-like beta-hydroxyacid dehydrogenase
VNAGFAGLGRMGSAMARRLLDAGHSLTVWNRSASRSNELVAAGARRAGSPRELGESSEIVVTMVSDGDALREVLHGDDGLLAGLGTGSVHVDMSTIGPAAAREFASEVTERGAAWLDAPVSGSTALAERGALTILAGGDAETLERVRPVLESMGQTIFHLGGTGAGAAMKVALQGVLSVINEAIAEGLVLAERSGIGRETAYDVFAGGAVASPYVQYKRGAFLEPASTPVAFTVDLMRKDLRLTFDLADEAGLRLPAVGAADEVLARAAANELGAADFARVADVLRESSEHSG